jgi:hypothetical protein
MPDSLITQNGKDYLVYLKSEVIFMQVLLSKKFIFALVVILMGFVLVLVNKVTSDVFFKFVEWVSGIYVVGNISDKVNDTKVTLSEK